MRICYLRDCTSNSVHDLRFVTKLVERGYDTNVVTFADNPVRIPGVKYHHIPFPELFFRSPRRLQASKKALIGVLNGIKPDVVHAGWIPSYGFLAAVSGFHPFLLMPFGSDILIKPRETFNFKESYLSIFNKVATRYVLKRADMITCDAEHVKNEIIKLSGYAGDKIIVFPWGIDLKRFNPSVDGGEVRASLGWQRNKILIMTRSFEPVYGIEYFLRALPEIIQQNPETRVILCGDGSLKDNLVSLVYELGISDYVHFAGRIENEKLPQYLRASDIYVSTSLSDGTSLSLLEAMACGLPVVVSDVPAIMEWIKDGGNGFVVPRHNIACIQDRIGQLLNDNNLRKKFGEKNSQIAQEKADWDKNFDKLEAIYRRLMNRD